MADHYDTLSRTQLISVLRKREAEKKLGLVWERDEIEADAAIDANFIACTIDPALSDGAAPWRNLVIEGDNFDALRWLRMTYAHRVKCIYIDPPYNTGNKDWVYNDHYIDPNDRYRHSTWLEFIYRRLILARDLLANDGVILVSINDENRAKLELLMDEALPGMRLGSFVWRTRVGGNDTKGAFLSDNHEHVLIYGKSDFRFGGTEKSFELYRHWDEKKSDWFRTGGDLTQPKNMSERNNAYYPLSDPSSGIWFPCNPDAVWRYSSIYGPKSRIKTRYMEDLVADGSVHFPIDQRVEVWNTREELDKAIAAKDVPGSGNAPFLRPDLPDLDFWVGKKVGFGTPSLKRYKRELKTHSQPLSSWITPNFEQDTVLDPEGNVIIAGTNVEAAKAVKDVFGEKAFNYAKPVSLIRELVRQSTSEDDFVLDFFAGSATTAQAVMEVNASDQGSRRFVMVSSTEATASELDKNLCRDVTAERIRRLNAADSGRYADLFAEFAYLRTREIDFDALNAELDPAEAWTALEAIHGLPLTSYNASRAWNEHASHDVTLILADRTDEALIARLQALAAARANAFVYSWTPGQLKTALGPVDFEIRPVRETLVKRFQQ